MGNLNVVMFAPEDLNLVKGVREYDGVLLTWKLDKSLRLSPRFECIPKSFISKESILKINAGEQAIGTHAFGYIYGTID